MSCPVSFETQQTQLPGREISQSAEDWACVSLSNYGLDYSTYLELSLLSGTKQLNLFLKFW